MCRDLKADMKYKLHTVEVSNGWAVVEVENGRAEVVLVDDFPTETEARECMGRLSKHTDRVVASFDQDCRKWFEDKVNAAEDDMMEFRGVRGTSARRIPPLSYRRSAGRPA